MGAFAVAEQGSISGANLALNVLLARWLQPSQYGEYALGFSIFLLLAAVYQAILIEPLSVVGPMVYHQQFPKYLGALLRIHLGASLIIMAALGCSALIAEKFGFQSLAGSLAGVGLAAPCVLLFWLTRYAAFVQFSSRGLSAGAMTYCLVLFTGIVIVSRSSLLTPFTAFVVTMTAALGGSANVMWRLRPEFRKAREAISPREVMGRHWFFGRWESASVVLNVLAQNISYAVTGASLGMAEVGALRAVMNFGLPVFQINSALRRVTQPYVSDLCGMHGDSATKAPVRTMAILFAVGGCVCFVCLLLFRQQIVRALYRGNFTEFANLVPLACLSAVLSMAAHPFQVGLRAMRRPASLFAVDGTAGMISLLLIVPAAHRFGVAGIVWVSVVSNLACWVVGLCVYHHRARAVVPSALAPVEVDPCSEG